MTTATLEATGVVALNELLKSCLALVDAYASTIKKVEKRHDEAAIALRVLDRDHVVNAHTIQKLILGLGGEPVSAPDRSDFIARGADALAASLSDGGALRGLLEAEKKCLTRALEAQTDVDGQAREVLESMVLARLARHVELLEEMAANLAG